RGPRLRRAHPGPGPGDRGRAGRDLPPRRGDRGPLDPPDGRVHRDAGLLPDPQPLAVHPEELFAAFDAAARPSLRPLRGVPARRGREERLVPGMDPGRVVDRDPVGQHPQEADRRSSHPSDPRSRALRRRPDPVPGGADDESAGAGRETRTRRDHACVLAASGAPDMTPPPVRTTDPRPGGAAPGAGPSSAAASEAACGATAPPGAERSPRILVVTPQPFYEDRGTPIALRYLLRALTELGYAVDLLVFPIGREIEIP